MTGFNSKREAAADKLQEPVREALKLALEALNAKVIGTTGRMQKTHNAITAIKAVLAQPAQERNFCSRCGKRTADLTDIHTCTPPQGAA